MSNVSDNTRYSINITNSKVKIHFSEKNVENKHTEKKQSERRVNKSERNMIEDHSLHERQVITIKDSSSSSEEIISPQHPKRKAKIQKMRPQHEKRQKVDDSMNQKEPQLFNDSIDKNSNRPDISLFEHFIEKELYEDVLDLSKTICKKSESLYSIDVRIEFQYTLIIAFILKDAPSIYVDLLKKNLNNLLKEKYPTLKSPQIAEKRGEVYQKVSQQYLDQSEYSIAAKIAKGGISKDRTQARIILYMILAKALYLQEKYEEALDELKFLSSSMSKPRDIAPEILNDLHRLQEEIKISMLRKNAYQKPVCVPYRLDNDEIIPNSLEDEIEIDLNKIPEFEEFDQKGPELLMEYIFIVERQ